METVKFVKPRVSIDPNFWAKFAELKIDKYKLDDKVQISLHASYSINSYDNGNITPLLLDCTSFNEDIETSSHKNGVASQGVLLNTNTFESYKQTNVENLIDTLGHDVIEAITSEKTAHEPWRLAKFMLFAYGDLKKHKFHYWGAHPTPYDLPQLLHEEKPTPIGQILSKEQLEILNNECQSFDCKSKCYFSIVKDEFRVIPFSEGLKLKSQGNDSVYFVFYDPCSSGEQPGWPLRNLLCFLFYQNPEIFLKNRIKVISLKSGAIDKSVVFTLKVKECDDANALKNSIATGRLVGWEANSNGKMGPNIADLWETMDPAKLTERATDLNLKLMKWRLVPNLDLEKVKNLRCLLLGAGTLGCSVARVLIGWGVKTITFVDSSNVSHSNTVRQSLYCHQDAIERKPKVLAAKDALLRILPSLNVEGVVMHIPMPGHVVGKSMLQMTKDAIAKLDELVDKHDVVFLLLDSREARWLPTVVCAAKSKIAMNAALGFDSYTVQRHGTRNGSTEAPELVLRNPPGKDLGCYFCNDVTPPGNSQVDRTLDQQCTVTRPGLSQIAAGLAVELMVALTQHPDDIEARAQLDENSGKFDVSGNEVSMGLLGGVPHTIRGSLWNHEMRLTTTHRFSSCTACSSPVVNEYKERGEAFVLDACNEPNYLEQLSGLDVILKKSDLDDLIALDSFDEEDNEADEK